MGFDDLLIIAMILVGIIGFGTIAVIYSHDLIFQEEEYKTERLFLEDIQYMDEGRVLYRFGDLVIKDFFRGESIEVNKYYEVVYIKYSNYWNNKNGIWEYYEIIV